MIRSFLFVLVVIAVAACGSSSTKPAQQRLAQQADQSPFANLGLRFDGYYQESLGDLRYAMRFFPEGRIVLVNGTKDIEADLPKFLVRETQGNPSMGLYNVMPEVRSDSIFFNTFPEKGEISYRGKVMSGSLVRFNRYSHINGVSQDKEYIFHPDTIPTSTEER